MKMPLTAAAALIGLATAFGPAGAAPAMSLPDGTPVIEVGGRHFGGHRRGGRDFGRHGGGRHFSRHGGGRRFDRHGGGRRFGRHGGHRGHGHGGGHDSGPYILGGVALGTFLFLNALDDY